jgi:hypothetical protein
MPKDAKLREMSLDDYKVVLYRNHPDGWVAKYQPFRVATH